MTYPVETLTSGKVSRRPGPRAAGFTLLEILIAVSILAIIAVLVQSSFRVVMGSLAEARRTTAASRKAESFIWMLSSEVGNAIIAEGLHFSAVGGDGAAGLDFCSTVAFPGSGARDVFRVSYRLDDDVLWKSVDGNEFKLFDGVEAFEIIYFDGEEWSPEWDFSAAGRLPAAVNVSFELEGRRFSRSIGLAVDLNLDAPSDDGRIVQ